MPNEMRRDVSRVVPFVLGVLLLVPATACQDRDLLSPDAGRHLTPGGNGTLSAGSAVASPVDVNTAGEVLGSLSVGTASHAAISLDVVAYDLGTTDNSTTTSTYPTAINNRGQVVGTESSGGGASHGFLWTPDQPNGTTGTMQRLPDGPNGPATASDVNDAGQIVGIDGAAGIVLWESSDVLSLPLPIPGGTVNSCTINQFGQIGGTAADASGLAHAFLWTPASPNGTTGSYMLLEAPGSAGGHAVALNDFGQLVVSTPDGNTQLWTPDAPNGQVGTWVTLMGPGGAIGGVDINSRGDVLANGYVDESYNAVIHVYLWRPVTPNGSSGTTIDLTPEIREQPSNAFGNFVGEEENATIQAFGYFYDVYNDYHEQVWTRADLDQPLTASILAISGSWEGLEITFDGDATPYSPSLTYQWDFGDGTLAAGRSAAHIYADNGQYTVRFTVTDDNAQSSTTTAVTVDNVEPSASFIAPPQTNEGDPYMLSVRDAFDASADLPTLQLALDCGDGRGYQSVAISASLTCAAPNDALRTARALLRDKDGGVAEYTAPVTIFDVAPTVTILSAPAAIASASTYTIAFTFTDPGTLDSWAYSIDWGDGTSSAPVPVTTQGGTLSASHIYQIDRRGGNKSQTFVVTIRVRDDSGAFGTGTSAVLVTGKGAR